MDVEEQIRRIFDNEISYNIVYSGIQDDISFIIEDDTFLVGNLRSTILVHCDRNSFRRGK